MTVEGVWLTDLQLVKWNVTEKTLGMATWLPWQHMTKLVLIVFGILDSQN